MGLGIGWSDRWAFPSFCLKCAFSGSHFDYIPMYFMYMSDKTIFFQYTWKYVNMKDICM